MLRRNLTTLVHPLLRGLPATLMLLLIWQCKPAPASSEAPMPPIPAGSAPREPPEPHALAATAPEPSPPPAEVATDWCTDDVSVLDSETCYVLPGAPTSVLVVYLHGIVPPSARSPNKTKVERVVANAARRNAFAALIPRGLQGLAGKKHPGWWGWPTEASSFRKHAGHLTERILASRRALEQRRGAPFQKVFLAGSSAGAYFTALMALHGKLDVDGFGILSGGAGRADQELVGRLARPFFVAYGTHDSVGSSARALAESVRSRGWPVCVRAHPLGHGAQEVYLDEAMAFWRDPSRCP